ncbi:endonuclease/exonuclease/phosphatase family protein [Rhizosaccharibacter radicis]|uniref:Endonuclease/exonuclease/phosphatase family protein n=1 Tax=Rhizosaccharibacter radicis TaxID=2782605 RepID=A0ABT1VVI7_9PROT|nr:endonuclease/exonuclease/phosphatase family protein [Acetobacteraceae bacterium KSS12]
MTVRRATGRGPAADGRSVRRTHLRATGLAARVLLPAAVLLGSLSLAASGRAAAGPEDRASGTIKLSTWNLDWFTQRPDGDPSLPADVHGRRNDDIARLAAYAARLHPDVAALEEVDGAPMAAKLFPPDRFRLEATHDDLPQRVVLAVARGIGVERHPDLDALDVPPDAITADDPRAGPVHHLRRGLDATLTLPGGETLRVLAVHLKSGCWDAALVGGNRPSCRILRFQLKVLTGWIAARRAEGIPFAVLGDFNRRLKLGDPFLQALQDAAPVRSATEGRASPCWGGEDFIDQIVVGGPARDWMVPGSLRVMVYHEPAAMKDALSDHCPTSVVLHPTPAATAAR